LSRHDGGDGGGGGRDAASREGEPEFVEGAVGAHARGVFRDVQSLPDRGKRAAIEETQDDGGAIGVGELVDRRIEHRAEAIPVGTRFADRGDAFERDGGGLARLPALFGDHEIQGRVARGGVEPGGEHGVAGEFSRVASELNEHLLRDIRRAVRVAAGATERGPEDEIDVPSDQFREGVLGAFLGITAEQ
jgi:hypothetical protein